MGRIKTKIENEPARTVFWLLGGSIAIILIAFLLERVDYDYTKIISEITKAETLKFVAGIFTSIAVGLLATAFYGMFNNATANKVLDGIHSVGYDGLIDSLINQVADYGGICVPYYRLEIKMKPSDCGKYIVVEQNYEYRKVLPGARTIYFRFKRLSNEDENEQLSSEPNLLSEDYKRYEFFFKLNDAQFYEKGVTKAEIDSHYGISDVFIDNNKVHLQQEGEMKDSFVANLPPVGENGKERLIKYTVKYPIDWDDYIFILFEFPSKDIRVKFDYSDIKDLIYFHRVEFLGYELGFSGDRGGKGGIAEISHTGWLLPKSGVIGIWYLKEATQSKPPQQKASPVRRRTATRRAKKT